MQRRKIWSADWQRKDESQTEDKPVQQNVGGRVLSSSVKRLDLGSGDGRHLLVVKPGEERSDKSRQLSVRHGREPSGSERALD